MAARGEPRLRVGDWKIVAAGKESPWELYDLSKDRGESNNLADQYPEKVSALAAVWDQHSEATRACALQDLPADAKSSAAREESKEKSRVGLRLAVKARRQCKRHHSSLRRFSCNPHHQVSQSSSC